MNAEVIFRRLQNRILLTNTSVRSQGSFSRLMTHLTCFSKYQIPGIFSMWKDNTYLACFTKPVASQYHMKRKLSNHGTSHVYKTMGCLLQQERTAKI